MSDQDDASRVVSTGHFVLIDAAGNRSDPIPYISDWTTINEAIKNLDVAVVDNWGRPNRRSRRRISDER